MNAHLAPPLLIPEKYRTWRKEMTFWEMATSVPAAKRAPTVFLTLKGKAREAVLEMDPESLNKDGGMNVLYGKLDKLFKIDSNQAALKAYGDFEKYVRPKDISISNLQI